MNTGTSFTFPAGSNDALRYRPVVLGSTSADDIWDISYIANDPTDGGYSHLSFADTVVKVSEHEYWEVAHVSPGTNTTANLTLTYGPGSYGAGSDIGHLDSLMLVHWDGVKWDVPPGTGLSISGDRSSGTVTVYDQS